MHLTPLLSQVMVGCVDVGVASAWGDAVDDIAVPAGGELYWVGDGNLPRRAPSLPVTTYLDQCTAKSAIVQNAPSFFFETVDLSLYGGQNNARARWQQYPHMKVGAAPTAASTCACARLDTALPSLQINSKDTIGMLVDTIADTIVFYVNGVQAGPGFPRMHTDHEPGAGVPPPQELVPAVLMRGFLDSVQMTSA